MDFSKNDFLNSEILFININARHHSIVFIASFRRKWPVIEKRHSRDSNRELLIPRHQRFA